MYLKCLYNAVYIYDIVCIMQYIYIQIYVHFFVFVFFHSESESCIPNTRCRWQACTRLLSNSLHAKLIIARLKSGIAHVWAINTEDTECEDRPQCVPVWRHRSSQSILSAKILKTPVFRHRSLQACVT